MFGHPKIFLELLLQTTHGVKSGTICSKREKIQQDGAANKACMPVCTVQHEMPIFHGIQAGTAMIKMWNK